MPLANKPTHSYQAPKESGTAVVSPSLAEAFQSQSNWLDRALRHGESKGGGIDLCGTPLETVRLEARGEAIQLAERYSREYRDVDLGDVPIQPETPLLLSGHQPELFHPGVWFKNYLLSESAKRLNCVALNFIVDNDLCRGASIKVPTRGDLLADRSEAKPPSLAGEQERANEIDRHCPVRIETVAWDAAREFLPFECRALVDAEVFNSFPSRVREKLLPEIDRPLVERLWRHAREAVQRTRLVGAALAQARHALEGEIGMQTLEVPLSRLASTRSFARFCLQLLGELPRFQQIYNARRDDYRRANRIRNDAHPVPALRQQLGWWEVPLWVYREEAPQRRPLFVRRQGDILLLSDQCGWQAAIEGPLDSSVAIDQWMEMLSDETYIRPRALLTTMYTRLVIGDVFVHGIGGGKYDELTDSILTEYFVCAAPPYVVASATLHLPIPSPPVSEDELRQARRANWELRFHADRYLEARGGEVADLCEKKRRLLANIPARGHKREWHRQISAINRRLSDLAAPQAVAMRDRIESCTAELHEGRLLTSREMSFCLFPLDWLDGQLKRLAVRHLG